MKDTPGRCCGADVPPQLKALTKRTPRSWRRGDLAHRAGGGGCGSNEGAARLDRGDDVDAGCWPGLESLCQK